MRARQRRKSPLVRLASLASRDPPPSRCAYQLAEQILHGLQAPPPVVGVVIANRALLGRQRREGGSGFERRSFVPLVEGFSVGHEQAPPPIDQGCVELQTQGGARGFMEAIAARRECLL